MIARGDAFLTLVFYMKLSSGVLVVLAGVSSNFLAPSSPRTKLLTSDCFIDTMGTMAEATSLTIECQKSVNKWKYPNSLAVGKNYFLPNA